MKSKSLCSAPWCRNPRKSVGKGKFDRFCSSHRLEQTASRKGMTVRELRNSRHPSRRFLKDKCENRDGRLGFKCSYKIRHSRQLEVDHKDGNPYNHQKSNLQTLCRNCHAYKTERHQDDLTPGRKRLKK